MVTVTMEVLQKTVGGGEDRKTLEKLLVEANHTASPQGRLEDAKDDLGSIPISTVT